MEIKLGYDKSIYANGEDRCQLFAEYSVINPLMPLAVAPTKRIDFSYYQEGKIYPGTVSSIPEKEVLRIYGKHKEKIIDQIKGIIIEETQTIYI